MAQQFRYTINYAGRSEDRLVVLRGDENVWDLYRFQVVVGSETRLELDKLLRQPAYITFQVNGKTERHLHGIVTSASFSSESRNKRFAIYELTIEPELALLKRRQYSRIFQQVDTKTIIGNVIGEAGIVSDRYRFNLQGDTKKRSYCVQYNETDWDFIRRLCEEEGWYFYFEHSEQNHTLVVTNHRQGRGLVEPKNIPFHEASSQASDDAHIFQFASGQGIVSDRFSLIDYNFEKPNLNLKSEAKIESGGLSQIFYPGRLTDSDANEKAAKRWLEAEFSDKYRCFGKSNHMRVHAGCEFALTGDALTAYSKEYFIVAVRHRGEQPQALEEEANAGPTRYENEMSFVPAEINYRNAAATKKRLITGVQTARVIGPDGEKIYTDEFGRIKVKFHWDVLGANDEHASCWLRVMQSWAGSAYGSFVLPRVGQEVVVQFENGDPDRPMVIGTVYNGVKRAPFDLPAQKTLTALRTQVVDGDGFNEIKIEDKADQAGISIESAKDWTRRIANDSKTWIGNELHLVVKKDQFEQVDGDKHQSIKSDVAIQVGGALTIGVGADMQLKVNNDFIWESSGDLHVKSGSKIVIEAGTEATLKVGGNFIKVDSSGVTVVGTQIKLNSGGSAGSGKGVSLIPIKYPAEAEKAKESKAEKWQAPEVLSPPAKVLLMAAQSGSAFCEKCEKPKIGNSQNDTKSTIHSTSTALNDDDSPPKKRNIKESCEKYWEGHKDDCSGFVKAVAKDHGITLSGQANEIVEQIRKSPWKILKDGVEAKECADAGKFVVAGLKESPNGHVVVVVSGPLAKGKYPSAYWGSIGGIPKKNATINWSWNKTDVDKVVYSARDI